MTEQPLVDTAVIDSTHRTAPIEQYRSLERHRHYLSWEVDT